MQGFIDPWPSWILSMKTEQATQLSYLYQYIFAKLHKLFWKAKLISFLPYSTYVNHSINSGNSNTGTLFLKKRAGNNHLHLNFYCVHQLYNICLYYDHVPMKGAPISYWFQRREPFRMYTHILKNSMSKMMLVKK